MCRAAVTMWKHMEHTQVDSRAAVSFLAVHGGSVSTPQGPLLYLVSSKHTHVYCRIV
jgi:hypothetical protein